MQQESVWKLRKHKELMYEATHATEIAATEELKQCNHKQFQQ
ncbi:MAG: hypothetical protein R2741_09455 [Methanolobus sp.]